MKTKPSICNNCKNAYAHKCKWIKNGTHIDGWTVNPSNIWQDGFEIMDCPNYDVVDKKDFVKISANSVKVTTKAKSTIPRKCVCAICGKKFETTRNTQKTCCKFCSGIWRSLKIQKAYEKAKKKKEVLSNAG